MSAHRTYLGDGVYVNDDGFMLTLTTEDGVRVTNTIHLELEVYAALSAYVQRRAQEAINAADATIKAHKSDEDHTA